MKTTVFDVLTLSCCFYGLLTVNRASGDNVIDQTISLPFDMTTNSLNRVKRQGGGGFIPFRPLFVYRQQQRERQERWKEIEAKKKLKEQYQQYEDSIKQSQLYSSHRPSTTGISYSGPATTQYTSYNKYPYTRYPSYSPSYYNQYQYEKDPYSNYYQKYYQNYYDGFDYSYF
ncbi:uncharacterized protein LOC119068177 [Bradysia coprophila]|uniref:uncharacterized protein LOC119068177 n=1 Tax=Bradysia coprophila TaxID=38358 RepID=UPI00187DD353|nr:uncharacterized protein LOC119068177 [Bradysia coprophila]